LHVGSRHIADRDAAAAGGIEVDRIDADPDLLDQPETRRGIDHRSGNRLQHMQQDIGVGYLAAERFLVGFVDNYGREIQRG
jgi:hypothetical protein